MKKTLAITLLVLVALFSNLFNVYAESTDILTTDFYTVSAPTQSSPLENNDTLLTIKDDVVNSRTIYGDTDNDYLVDLQNLTFKIAPQEIEKFGRFTITFTDSRETQPLISGEGISFVFRSISNGSQLEIAILDTKTGELINEMKGVEWAYLGNEGNNWQNGVVGVLNGKNGKVQHSEMILKFQMDSASSGGTTFRPAMQNSLGVVIPLSLFTARSLDINNLVMMISSGEGNLNYNFETENASSEESGSDLTFKISSIEDTNSKKYRQSTARTTLINDITTYTQQASQLKEATLAVDLFTELVEKAFDLNGLRSRDKVSQQERIENALDDIGVVTAALSQSVDVAQAYLDKNIVLEELSTINEADVIKAKAAKTAFENIKKYTIYLTNDVLEEVNSIIENINETFILRADLHIQLNTLESAVNVFKDDLEHTNPSDILLAIEALDVIDDSLFNELDLVDKNSFTERYTNAESIIDLAIESHYFSIIKERISNYYERVNELTVSSDKEAFFCALEIRPSYDAGLLTATEKDEIESLLLEADQAFEQIINHALDLFVSNYQAAVDPLEARIDLTQRLINEAEDAKYDAELIECLLLITETLELDIDSKVDSLYAMDRLVSVAKVFLTTAIYAQAIEEVTVETQLGDAYQHRALALSHLENEIFNEIELNEYQLFFETTDSSMNTKAKAYIDTKIQKLEEEIEDNLNLNIEMNQAKAALRDVPNINYLTNEEDYQYYLEKYEVAYSFLKEHDLYFFTTDDSSSWYAQSTDVGVKLTGMNNEGIMNLEEPLNIDGLDMVFDYTKIGRIWAGQVTEDGVTTAPQNILVLNFMREYGRIKDQSQGFSIYLNPNVLGELEVLIYGPDRAGQLIQLAQGKIGGNIFDDPENPFEIRIRISKVATPLNAYQIWINSLKLNIYYRDFINFEQDSPLYIPEFEVGSEIGEHVFIDDKAQVSFVLFGQDLKEEEKESSITIKKLNEKTFAGYVAPLLPIEMFIDQEPTKMTYEKGETLDLTGLIVRVVMSDGSEKVIDVSDLQVAGFTSSSQGNKVVSLIYTEQGITLTKVIRVTVVDSSTTDTGDDGSSTLLIIGIIAGSVLLLGGVGTVVFLNIRKRRAQGPKA